MDRLQSKCPEGLRIGTFAESCGFGDVAFMGLSWGNEDTNDGPARERGTTFCGIGYFIRSIVEYT
jgi:hypothetical protein